jgi:hypothetical protein
MSPKRNGPKRTNCPAVHNGLNDRRLTPDHAIARPGSGFAQKVDVPEGPKGLGKTIIFKLVIDR